MLEPVGLESAIPIESFVARLNSKYVGISNAVRVRLQKRRIEVMEKQRDHIAVRADSDRLSPIVDGDSFDRANEARLCLVRAFAFWKSVVKVGPGFFPMYVEIGNERFRDDSFFELLHLLDWESVHFNKWFDRFEAAQIRTRIHSREIILAQNIGQALRLHSAYRAQRPFRVVFADGGRALRVSNEIQRGVHDKTVVTKVSPMRQLIHEGLRTMQDSIRMQS